MTTVAVIGATSLIGKATLTALTTTFADKIKFPIIATSRSIEGKESTDKVKYVAAKLTEETYESDAKIFEGVDVIVELLGFPNPEGFKVVEKIVGQVKPKLFIPSQFGSETTKVEELFPGILTAKIVHSDNARATGVKTVDIVTSFFFLPGLYLYELVGHAGIDAANGTVTYRGDPDFKIAATAPADIGKTVASVVALGNYQSLPDEIKIYSDLISNREIAERYEKDHNVTLKVLGYESKEESLEKAQKYYADGGQDFFYLLHVVSAQGDGHGNSFRGQDSRELVNPGEKYWKWTKF